MKKMVYLYESTELKMKINREKFFFVFRLLENHYWNWKTAKIIYTIAFYLNKKKLIFCPIQLNLEAATVLCTRSKRKRI